MKIGITVPNNWGVQDVRDVVALGQQAEQLGFDSIWTMDHLLNIGFVRDRLDNKPYFHPLGILSFLAARTTTIALGTSVMVLPYHNPIELAKYSVFTPQVPSWPAQRSTVSTSVPGIHSSASRVFWPTFCTREWQGMW